GAMLGRDGVFGNSAGDGVGQPEAAPLVPRQALGPLEKCFDVTSAYAPMSTDGCEREVSLLAKVDDVLARRVEDGSCLASRQELVGIGFHDPVVGPCAHPKRVAVNPRNTR